VGEVWLVVAEGRVVVRGVESVVMSVRGGESLGDAMFVLIRISLLLLLPTMLNQYACTPKVS
jgi:hypothetical protein